MGWKTSLIIIENKERYKDEISILKAIGKENYKYEKNVFFDECMYSNDESISIGYFNDNIIICDDYQITINSLDNPDYLNLNLIEEEKNLTKLFPNSEIISIACHSVVNYHAYSLIKNGKKIRLKYISADDDLIEFGSKMKEEESIYESSYQKNGRNYWQYDFAPDEEFAEDQLMEDFTFGIAKRRLGVRIDSEEGEKLLETKFKKFIKPHFLKSLWNTILKK